MRANKFVYFLLLVSLGYAPSIFCNNFDISPLPNERLFAHKSNLIYTTNITESAFSIDDKKTSGFSWNNFYTQATLSYGNHRFTENLNQHYSNNWAIRSAVELYYKRVGLKMGSHWGRSKTENDVAYSLGIWEKGSIMDVLLGDISLAFQYYDNHRISVFQSIGLGYMSVTPPTADRMRPPEYSEISLDFSKTYCVEIGFDLKFGNGLADSARSNGNYRFFRFSYHWNNPTFEQFYENRNGLMHGFSIGLGFNFSESRSNPKS
jgi:hypothetical protein